MCFSIFKRFTNFRNKYVFCDTNCYRFLGREANRKGLMWLDSFLKELKQKEHKKRITVKVSYLVLSEMLAHLDEPIDSNNYLECKHGLYAALYHSKYDLSNLLPNADNEFVKFLSGKSPIADTYRENSLYNMILQINNNGFADSFIKSNSLVIGQAKDYLFRLKSSWRDSFLNYYIKKHDPSYTGNWQVFSSDLSKRNKLLRELRKAKSKDLIYYDFGRGMYLYVKNNMPGEDIPDLTKELLERIVQRFKPMFALQYRIMEFMCQSGYNLDKYLNDIIDYLIISNLEIGKSVFVSNETKHLVPNLHAQGYKTDVWTFEQYCAALSISYK